ncbi:MAG: hypothetical protein ACTSR0_04145 [Candidatus Asgardarchaeia archaeon]
MKGMVRRSGILYINCTSHPLDFAEAEPDTLNHRRVDFTVPVFTSINIKFTDTVTKHRGITFLRREPILTAETHDKMRSVIDAVRKEKKEGEVAVIILSFPALSALAFFNNQTVKEDIFLCSIVSATRREIKPPVACALHFSIL